MFSQYRLIKAIGMALGLIPLRISYPLAAIGGQLYFYLAKSQAKNAIGNMRRVLGPGASESHVRRVAAASFRYYALFMVDFMRFPLVTLDYLKSIPTSGWENMDMAIAAGKGIVIIGPHFGNWDMAGAILGASKYPCIVLVDTLKPEGLNQLVQETRTKFGLRVFPVESNVLGIFKALKKNEVLMVMSDRPMIGEKGGVPIQFFGETAYFQAGAATLALKTGAKIIPAFLVRNRNRDGYWGRIGAALEYETTGDKDKDIQLITQAVASAIENIIRVAPEQWYMFRPMWGDKPGKE
jgi:lauroyl/myristoyl acyltransferase